MTLKIHWIVNCGLEAQSTAHFLLHKEGRGSTWPTKSSQEDKLQGTVTDLRLTVRFIALMGLQIRLYHIGWCRRSTGYNKSNPWSHFSPDITKRVFLGVDGVCTCVIFFDIMLPVYIFYSVFCNHLLLTLIKYSLYFTFHNI